MQINHRLPLNFRVVTAEGIPLIETPSVLEELNHVIHTFGGTATGCLVNAKTVKIKIAYGPLVLEVGIDAEILQIITLPREQLVGIVLPAMKMLHDKWCDVVAQSLCSTKETVHEYETSPQQDPSQRGGPTTGSDNRGRLQGSEGQYPDAR